MKTIIKFLATGFYSGFFPSFPGTVGSLLAFILAWFLNLNIWSILLLTILGVYICTQGELLFQEHDCPHLVFDEFCGAFCATWQLSTLPQFIMAFVLFRFFDILKPAPINTLQKLPRGWGVMADDLAAGIITRFILALLIYFGIM
jgi:phosphatidylglycerophosphatase A